jgi:hypothetical protein
MHLPKPFVPIHSTLLRQRETTLYTINARSSVRRNFPEKYALDQLVNDLLHAL